MHPWATENAVVPVIVHPWVRSFSLASHKFVQISNLLVQILAFLLMTVLLAEFRGLKLVIG